MLNTNNVIESHQLTYAPYHQSRGEGFSGQLLFASEMKNPEKKYIIKAAQAHVAACEYMFYSLAARLGFCAARVRFIKPAKPNEFEYPACAVDFMPNAMKLKYDEYTQIEECTLLTDLSFILGDRDNPDFLKDEHGIVCKIDHSDCFGIEGTAETWINPSKITIEYMFYQMSKPTPNISFGSATDACQNMLKKISGLALSDFSDDFSLISQFCGAPFEAHFRHYIGSLIQQCKSLD